MEEKFGEKLTAADAEYSRCDKKERDSMHVWMLRLAHTYMAMDYRRLTEMGIHPGQLPVMRAVSMREGITQRELARELQVKPPTIAVTIKRMEKAGLLCRREDRADMRVCRIYLTKEGRQLGKKLKALMEENEAVLLNGFTEEEILQLKGYFGRIIQNMGISSAVSPANISESEESTKKKREE